MKRMLIVLIMVISLSNKGFAQSGMNGGGDPTASDLQNFINQIVSYLLTEEGKGAFNNKINLDLFHKIAPLVKPVVKDERVYDSFGVEQACISHVEEKNRYIQCDLKRLPKLELNNQPTFYRLMFHELLFQTGYEVPKSKDVPSDFSISSTLELHIESYEKYVPGKSLFNSGSPVSEACANHREVVKNLSESLFRMANFGSIVENGNFNSGKQGKIGKCAIYTISNVYDSSKLVYAVGTVSSLEDRYHTLS